MRSLASRGTRNNCGLVLPLLNHSSQSSHVLAQAAAGFTISVEDAGGNDLQDVQLKLGLRGIFPSTIDAHVFPSPRSRLDQVWRSIPTSVSQVS